MTAAGNTELCKIIDVEPKSQCRTCLTHWSARIVYCTCGHLMKNDTSENKKYISSVLDLFSIPNFCIRKSRPHGHKYGKKGCKEYHTAKLHKRCRKKQYENIHDRFIRDKFFRKTMIELSRSEEIILEMDRLASENHNHIATQEEIDVYRGDWWIRSNVVNFDTMPTRRQLDFKWASSTMHRLKKPEDKTHHENWSETSSSWWQWQTTWWHPYCETSPQKMDWTLIERGNLCIQWATIHFRYESQQELNAKFIVNIWVTTDNSLLSPVGGVKRTSPDTENHEQNGYGKVYDNKCTFMTNVDTSDTTYTDKNTRTTCVKSEHACTLFDVLSSSHMCHTHICSSRLLSLSSHLHAMHMCGCLGVGWLLLLHLTALPRLLPVLPSPCTPTILTPWLTTCATPPKGPSSPIPSRSQFTELRWTADVDGPFKKQHRNVDFRAWKIDDSFKNQLMTNNSMNSFPINLIQIEDLILFCH